MQAPQNSFVQLMERVRQGDQDAAREICRNYFERLVRLASKHMNEGLRQKEDPADVVNSVLKSFFHRQRDRPFDVCSPESLWGLLAKITLRKCGHRVEHYLAARRDIRREAAVPESVADSSAVESVGAIAREPSPDEVATFRDLLDELMRDMDDLEREIVRLRLENYSVPEISRKVGRSEHRVRKLLDRVADLWQRLNS